MTTRYRVECKPATIDILLLLLLMLTRVADALKVRFYAPDKACTKAGLG